MTTSDVVRDAGLIGEPLRVRSDEIEMARGLPADVVATLVEADLMRFWVPASCGGGEVSAVEGVAAITEMARHDGAAAWCVMIANTTGLVAGFLDPTKAQDLFGPPGAVGGGFAQPMGRARAVDGGLEVTGRWSWGSGTGHCSVIGGGALLTDDEGAVTPRSDGLTAPFVLFERDQVEILDTWHTLGLAGSGSNDYQVAAGFVPEGRWVQLGRDAPIEPGPLYRFSLFGLLAAGVAAVAVGLAQRALEEFVALATEKTPQGSSRVLADRAASQALVADTESTIRSSQRHLLGALEDGWRHVEQGDAMTVEHRRAIRLAATDATRRSVDAVVALFRAAGGEAVYRRCALERVVRDALVAGQHAMVADRTRELLGRVGLGLDADTSQL